jgi:voltage-gated sodium channel
MFDVVFGVVIMFNLVLVVIETDVVAKDEEPPAWVEVLSWMILFLFCIELALRLWVQRCAFWVDSCNIFDCVLVIVDVIFNVMGLIAGDLFPVTFLRIVRLCKLGRVCKAFHVFPELRLMMAGLIGSMKAIVWGTVLLMFTLLVWSIIAVQFIHPLNKDLADRGIHGDCQRCGHAYGTVFNSFLTFCQQVVAGDAWGLMTLEIIEEFPLTAVFFASVYLSVGMAVLNLILGVVVDVASQAREKMIEDIHNDELIERNEVHSHLFELCKNLDIDGDGMITQSEVLETYRHNEAFKSSMTHLDIHEEDLGIIWTTLEPDELGQVNYKDFLTSCYKLKSSNTHFMLIYIKYYITVIKDKICSQIDGVKEEVTKEEKMLEKEEKMLEEEAHVSVNATTYMGAVVDDSRKNVDSACEVITDLDKCSAKVASDINNLQQAEKMEWKVRANDLGERSLKRSTAESEGGNNYDFIAEELLQDAMGLLACITKEFDAHIDRIRCRGMPLADSGTDTSLKRLEASAQARPLGETQQPGRRVDL